MITVTRQPIIAGNWKMYKTPAESIQFVRDLAPKLLPYHGVERVVCPTFLALTGVAEALQGSPIKVGAQNTHWEKEGAYTSQIAYSMLVGLVEYVIIGHSECRAYLGETDEMINRKAKALLSAGLKPIIAVGESLAQNEAGETASFVSQQVRAALADISPEDMPRIVFAYEPIWAIGTGKNATAEDANRIIRDVVRDTIKQLYGPSIADVVRIQYGGSVKPENMHDYMSQSDIDGALVGGASLKVDSFSELVRIAADAKGV